MGNGTKVALVALLILMVVVIARFVGDSGEEMDMAVDRAVKPDAVKPEALKPDRRKGAVPPSRAGSGTDRVDLETDRRKRAETRQPPRRTRGSYSNVPPGRGQRSTTGVDGAGTVGPGGQRPLTPPVSKNVAPVGEPKSRYFVPTPSLRSTVDPAKDGALEEGNRQPAPIITTLPERYSADKTFPKTEKKQLSKGPHTTVVGPGKTNPEKRPFPRNPGVSDSSYPKTHTVKKGDSYWALAKRYYGHGTIWRQIEKANAKVKLQPGKKLTIPAPVLPPSARRVSADPGSQRIASRATGPSAPSRPAPAGFTLYKVKQKDTLMALAKHFYNDSSRYDLIENANRAVKYGGLKAGTTIKIPSEKRK